MNIMKNVKVIGYGLLVMGMLLVGMPTQAQNFREQEQPQAQFQSTSTMTPVGSVYSANPSLNADGTAYSPAAQAPSGPRRAPNPINNDEDWEERKEDIGTGVDTPVGDAVLPLTLCAMLFAGVIALRRRRSALNR